MITRTITIGDGTVQIRTLSWAEFYRIRPDRKPDNDNERRSASLAQVKCQLPSYDRGEWKGDNSNKDWVVV